jgi:DNA processing protein
LTLSAAVATAGGLHFGRLMKKFPLLRLDRCDPSRSGIFEAIPDAPDQLWVQGRSEAFAILDRLPDRGFGVVGTRAPTPRSLAQIRGWVAELRNSQLVIVSGFARGVDAEAHRSAIEAGISTIAVLASGIGFDYPVQNRSLKQAILERGGLLVSESEPEARPRPSDFLRRNRIIAGWSQAVWIAEAPAQSGSLNTACWARDIHKICFATPCQPGDPAFAGNQELLDHHHALPLWGAHSLGAVWLELSGLGLEKSSAKSVRNSGGNRMNDSSPLLARIRERTFRQGGESVSALLDWAMATGIEPSDFFEALGEVVARGLCREENGVIFGI